MNNYLLEVIIGSFIGHSLADLSSWLMRKNKMNRIIRVDCTDDLLDIKPARLINANTYEKCSNCGALIDIRDGFGYCPYCGSMLGENNNE